MPDPSSPERSQIVPPEQAGKRLDVVLARWLEVSRAQVRALLESGGVALDGRRLGRRDKGLPLPAGVELRVAAFVAPADRRAPPATGEPLCFLAEGPGWVAVDKPAGIPVHPLLEDETETVLGHVAARHPEIHGVGEGGLRSGVVHRLDVETSGVLLMATEQAIWERLRAAFRGGRVHKVYRALAHGELTGELEVELMVRVSQHKPARVRVVPASEAGAGARPISMRVRPLERLRGATLVEVVPTTGFLHQIRVALAHEGFPLLGDRVYGDPHGDDSAARHMLHAQAVRFEEIEAQCEAPADFLTIVDALRG